MPGRGLAPFRAEPIRFADEADLLAQIRAGEDGDRRSRRPARHLPAAGLGKHRHKRAFLGELLRKAGCRPTRLPLQGLALPVVQVEGIEQRPSRRWWHALPDGRVQCDLCPRDCKLHEGQRGLCFVRKMEQGRMVLTTYGRSSGFCVDPVEKKPLNHFYPGTSILSFGTAGCNLACKFCQNWDISKSREMDRLQDQATPQAIAQAALDLKCRSVVPTTIRSSSPSTRWTSPMPATTG